jgi:hypothetical protein
MYKIKPDEDTIELYFWDADNDGESIQGELSVHDTDKYTIALYAIDHTFQVTLPKLFADSMWTMFKALSYEDMFIDSLS